MEPTIITHKFTNWDDIPDTSHLEKINDSYVKAFKGDIVYVSYIVQNNKLTAFGSAGYYAGYNYYGVNKTRQLWIEGMVSTVPGHGSIVLRELENALIMLADSENVACRIINVMSVDQSITFYEKNGYTECKTSVRFRGTGNTRLAKAIGNFNMASANIVIYEIDEDCRYWIGNLIIGGRVKRLEEIMHIPSSTTYNNDKDLGFAKYVLSSNKETLFKDIVPSEYISEIIKYTEDELEAIAG